MIVKLPILFHNDTTLQFDELGLDYPLSDCPIKETIFFHIAAIAPHIDSEDGTVYTHVYADGHTFICILNVEEVSKLIKEGMK